ncbi:hypothetical protein V6Z12_D10G150500 [Gossypium hirsutum]
MKDGGSNSSDVSKCCLDTAFDFLVFSASEKASDWVERTVQCTKTINGITSLNTMQPLFYEVRITSMMIYRSSSIKVQNQRKCSNSLINQKLYQPKVGYFR